ncbi:hypothetical protein DL95DRAFT_507736 [Leptodontidium sp. 2 PMI_412]|nr:hypothetical protein DL95DRAFT_507736 [Leptodontidium sp. 2 PMI_412]
MAPSKRNRSATLAKSPPGSPIRPITKRPRQKTPEIASSSSTSHLPLRPTKLTTTSTPTAFNSSQIDESEGEDDMRTRLINESESEEESESESEEEDDITHANEYLDQDLEELGPDRLDREETDESDAENELPVEFKRSRFFNQSVIDSKGNWKMPFEKKEFIFQSTLKSKKSQFVLKSVYELKIVRISVKLRGLKHL